MPFRGLAVFFYGLGGYNQHEDSGYRDSGYRDGGYRGGSRGIIQSYTCITADATQREGFEKYNTIEEEIVLTIPYLLDTPLAF